MLERKKDKQVSKTDAILGSHLHIAFDPEKVNAELIGLLEEKSSSFILMGQSHTYQMTEEIFSRTGPIDISQYRT